mgnify:CR=1 FL=1|tara:strand:- start:215 stop:523 length:309 start_codon:yes stop_codon:yes gene_type:complete
MRNKNWIEFSNKNTTNENIEEEVYLNQPKKLKIHKEKKGKKGKTVTIVSGFGSKNTLQISELLKRLKVYCGTGGSLNDQGIQLQGDMQDKIKFFLRKEGYTI